MKKSDFVKKINEAGMGGKVFIKPNNYVSCPFSYGCFFDGKYWVVYETEERGRCFDILRTENEDEAFQCLFEYMSVRI